MFLGFFYHLRHRGLAVGVQEWMTLMEGLSLGLAGESQATFYHLARCLVVKRETQLDLFDQCFLEHFKGVEAPQAVKDELEEWLKNAKMPRPLSPEELARLKKLDLDELKRLFEERMAEQKERHDGGNRWIGTGGTSPFGHGGQHPSGIRVHGTGGGRSALKVAGERRFRNLRGDAVLDTRMLSLALKRLRVLAREGTTPELDIGDTIDATARNAGDIDLKFRPSRKNAVKLLLLVDTGGSMSSYARLCDQLFSAASSLNHFKEFRHYYFHNCVYDDLFTDAYRLTTMATTKLLKDLDASWYLLMVGDAAMAPYELTASGGCIDYSVHNEEPGRVWLQRLRSRFPRSAWLNPEPVPFWDIASTQIVRKIFPEMFPLTVNGLSDAVRSLRDSRRPQR